MLTSTNGRLSDTTADDAPLSAEAFVERLRAQSTSYHHIHPFHVAMNAGELSRAQIQGWAANRFAYQRIIPIKDAAIMSNCPFPAIRRGWMQRIVDHDGAVEGEGGIEAWLRLAEAVGLTREEVLEERHLVPGVRFATEAYVSFARTKPWIEAVASSLTELFAPDLMRERIAAFERYYTWVDPVGLGYFKSRLTQAPRDASSALDLTIKYCSTRDQQERAIAALAFKCELLKAVLDAIEFTYRSA